MKLNSQIFFFMLWTVILMGIIYWVYLWIDTQNIDMNIGKINQDLLTTITPQRMNQYAREAAHQDCSIPPPGLGYTAWEDWDPLLPAFHQHQSQSLAVNSLADMDPRQVFCDTCSGDLKEGFTTQLFDWMNSKKQPTPQEQDAAIFEAKDPLVPSDPVVQPEGSPVFPYPGLDAEGKRETLPGTLPVPADFPASDRYDTVDADQRKAVMSDASKLLDRLQQLRSKISNNPKPTMPLGPTTPNLPRSDFVDLPTVDAKKANKFVPSPEPINQSMGPNPMRNQGNFPDALPNARFTEEANARAIGYGKANQIPSQPPGAPTCRFLNTPQCSPDFPYYTGANIGMEGGGQLFRCNGPDDGEQAEAVATIENGEIKRAYLVKPGKGYTMAPKVSVMNGGGSRAKLESRIDPRTGRVIEIVVRDGGFGFHSTPTIKLEAPGMSNQCYLCCSSTRA